MRLNQTVLVQAWAIRESFLEEVELTSPEVEDWLEGRNGFRGGKQRQNIREGPSLAESHKLNRPIGQAQSPDPTPPLAGPEVVTAQSLSSGWRKHCSGTSTSVLADRPSDLPTPPEEVKQEVKRVPGSKGASHRVYVNASPPQRARSLLPCRRTA